MSNYINNSTSDLNNNIWWVVEYMDGSIHQVLVWAANAQEARTGFKQIIKVVKFH